MLKNAGYNLLLHTYIVKSSLFRKSPLSEMSQNLSEMLHCLAMSYQSSAVGYLPYASSNRIDIPSSLDARGGGGIFTSVHTKKADG